MSEDASPIIFLSLTHPAKTQAVHARVQAKSSFSNGDLLLLTGRASARARVAPAVAPATRPSGARELNMDQAISEPQKPQPTAAHADLVARDASIDLRTMRRLEYSKRKSFPLSESSMTSMQTSSIRLPWAGRAYFMRLGLRTSGGGATTPPLPTPPPPPAAALVFCVAVFVP